ncbi:hypothetical protein [Puia dinghuensis]|nr:hypothetical protein [Puia dinghuensis]
MGLMHEMVKYRIEEWAGKGKRISFRLAWYTVNAEQLDGMIWLLMKGNRSKEEIMVSLKVSVAFVEGMHKTLKPKKAV